MAPRSFIAACLSLTAIWPLAAQVQVGPGVVSAHALAHKPPKAARRELDRGLQSWHKGRNDEALEHLTDAVRLDPGFVEAHIGLGAFYDDINQPALALDHFNRALLLDPQSLWATVAKAAVLLTLNRPAEAEQVARRALQLSPGLIQAHYLVGAALVVQEKITPEAAEHLRIAAPQLPQAQPFLADVQARLAESPDH
jgi:tetratricopeptide (TPR) repeat protein